MLNENADKEYLAGKVAGYLEQGDKEMAERFMDAYLERVGSTRDEIMQMVKTTRKKAKTVKKEVKQGDE